MTTHSIPYPPKASDKFFRRFPVGSHGNPAQILRYPLSGFPMAVTSLPWHCHGLAWHCRPCSWCCHENSTCEGTVVVERPSHNLRGATMTLHSDQEFLPSAAIKCQVRGGDRGTVEAAVKVASGAGVRGRGIVLPSHCHGFWWHHRALSQHYHWQGHSANK